MPVDIINNVAASSAIIMKVLICKNCGVCIPIANNKVNKDIIGEYLIINFIITPYI